MSTSEKTRVEPQNHFNHASSEVAGLTPRVETSQPTSVVDDLSQDSFSSVVVAANYTKMVQFSDQEEADTEIGKAIPLCTKAFEEEARLRPRKWWAVSVAAVVYVRCTQQMIDEACDKAGIRKANKRANEGPRFRDFVRLMFGLKKQQSEAVNRLNDKDVAIYSRYVETCVKRLKAEPSTFEKDPVKKLVKIIASYGNLDDFAPTKSGQSKPSAPHSIPDSLHHYRPLETITASAETNDAEEAARPRTTPAIPPAEPSIASAEEGGENSASGKKAGDDAMAGDHVEGTVAPIQEAIAKEKSDVWLERFKNKMRNAPDLQTITLANPPTDLCNMPAILIGEYNNGNFTQWTATNFRPHMSETIWNIANTSPNLASDCVRAIADAVRTGMIPDFLHGEEKVWKAHHNDIKSKFCLSLASSDTFLFSTPACLSCPVTRIRVKKPVISDAFTPLCLNRANFAEVVDWYHDCIGQTFANDILSHPSTGNSSFRELAVDWCFRSDLLSFEPFAEGAWQANFAFDTFEPDFDAVVHSGALTALFFEFVRPWIREVSKRQQSKRSNTKIIELHLGKKFGFEFNQSPGGRGEQFDLPADVTKVPGESIDLAFLYADFMPVLAFFAVTPNLTAKISANHDGILLSADLGYADCSVYVPALTNDRKQTRTVLFTQFP